MAIKKIKAGNTEYDIAAKYDDNEQEISRTYMTKHNPTGTGSFSLNRKAGTTVGDYSVAEGLDTTASGDLAHAEGEDTVASGHASHAEGFYTIASGNYSHAEGGISEASGTYSHAEGLGRASGTCSHAEGTSTASGDYSHAEGTSTASGEYSHAEGYGTASGEHSHAEGYDTKASSQYQHVQGKYNVEDTNDIYAHIVGNGTNSTPSNAHTLDWEGNAWFAGSVVTGGDKGVQLIYDEEEDALRFVFLSSASTPDEEPTE